MLDNLIALHAKGETKNYPFSGMRYSIDGQTMVCFREFPSTELGFYQVTAKDGCVSSVAAVTISPSTK
jgi:hypothetical protein